MKNMLYYLDKFGHISLHDYPFNEVDSLILSQICYLNLDDFIRLFYASNHPNSKLMVCSDQLS
jgi:hypothetical protein